ncbi:hypothetical protein [Streptomyces rishiriensis]|uniref:Uncharacterized protein n=1 Tax=Streptomyces rishiriensis TaxID=68264 RepID=A0ABU0NSQ1_STRRH|nr:hypothetical protein [Streptomyces rishiriensis]MDQ0582186.1 hypothetical protein [Streptomyces rishiriensis]
MAADEEVLRRKAAFAVARDLRRHETRALFEASGYRSDEEIVVALESDTVEDVFSRVRRHSPPVAVAIFWPEAGRLEYTSFKPSDEVSSLGEAREQVGGTATIGMLFEQADRQKRGQYRFNLTWDKPAMNIQRFEAAPA